jgi:hypothetical protein
MFGLGGYWVGARQQQSSPQLPTKPRPSWLPTATPIQQLSPALDSDWKTYIDQKQRYTIKYPNDWHVFSHVAGGIVPGYDATIISSATELDPHGETLAGNGAGILIGIVDVHKSPQEPLVEYSKRKFKFNESYREISLGSVDAIKEEDPERGTDNYLVSNGNIVYTIVVEIKNNKYAATVNKVLSTMDFLQI